MKWILLIGLVFLLVGCGSVRPADTDQDYRSGTQSLTIDFLSNQREVFADSRISFVVELENVGGHDIYSGELLIRTDDTFFSFDQDSHFFELEGRSAFNPRGGKTVKTFSGIVQPLEQQSVEQTVDVIATACYDYLSNITETVCIDPDPYGIQENSIPCQQSYSFSPPGAPVYVQNVEVQYDQTDFSVTPKFIFTVAHTDNGILYRKSYGSVFCSSFGTGENIANVVYFDAYLSDLPLECDTNELELVGGKARVVCTGPLINTQSIFDSYDAPLDVILEYGYTLSKSTQLIVQRR